MKRVLVCLFALLLTASVSAKEVYNINRDWKFFTYNENAAVNINLPHMWNNDVLSGRADYYRGIGNYLRYINTKPEWEGKRVFIKFYGANLVTDLLIDGKHVGQHKGGCNAFTFDITEYITCGERSLFWIIVNNTQTINVLPTAGADNAYGGIFRDVEIIVTEPVAISVADSSEGISVTTDNIDNEQVSGTVNVNILAPRGSQATVRVSIMDENDDVVFAQTSRIRTNERIYTAEIPFSIENPKLWEGTFAPNLYNVRADVLVDTVVYDSATITTGFRTLKMGNNGRILLNGRPYPINGVVIHRDRATAGSAMSEREIEDDMDILCEMGANAVRVAGGSHHPHFYELCDERGIMVINDLPFIGATVLNNKGFFNTKEFRDNGRMQLTEMITQLSNHPSVMAWNLFSELELRGETPIEYIKELNSLAKELDPSRFTAGYSNQDGEINFITDLISWSHTFGWLEGLPEDITLWQDQLHRTPEWDKLNSAVGYKCGGAISHVADTLQKPILASNWHPENWQSHFNEVYYSSIGTDTLLWGTFVDALFDYGSVLYTHGEGLGVNDTGLVSFDRKTYKDAFYLYKANWNKNEPFVYITEKRRQQRRKLTQQIKAYSNLPEAELWINDESVGLKTAENGILIWDNVTLAEGDNKIEVKAGDYSDDATINVATNFSRDL